MKSCEKCKYRPDFEGEWDIGFCKIDLDRIKVPGCVTKSELQKRDDGSVWNIEEGRAIDWCSAWEVEK